MNYSLKMARLDYFTCKPNIISYFTLIPVTIIFSFMSTSSIFIFNFTAAWFIALMSTNIFVVQEKNELERLYASLSLTTQNIVAGRYIYTDMYPFYWTSSERGIFMRYTYEFKKKAVELYRQGKWIDAPNDIINLKNFHDMIVRWHHLEESNTSDCLKHYGTNKKWSPEEKYELVARVIAGDTITSVAYTVGINSGLLAQWIRKYKIWGYNGLVGRRKGRKPKESAMKKMNINNPRKLNESEYEELIRLRAEITYIKAENEAIKKEIALREEREAALLKAKKQQSSKNSKKKDIC